MQVAEASNFEVESITLEEALQQTDSSGSHAQHLYYISNAASAAAGMSMSIAPFLMQTIPDDLQYDDWQTSLLASSTFWGMFTGSLMGGVFCDYVGPGRVTLITLAVIATCGAAPAALPALMIPARILVGMGLVTTYLATHTYLAEWASIEKRGPYLSALHIWMAVGGIAVTLLAIVAQTYDINWRTFLVLNSVAPILVLVLFSRIVLASESPRWLLVNGAPGATRRMLCRVARQAGGQAVCRESGCDCVSGGGDLGGSLGASGTWPTLQPISLQQVAAARGPRASTVSQVDFQRDPQEFTVCSRSGEVVRMWRLVGFGAILSFSLNFGSKGSEIWVGSFVKEMGLGHLSLVIYLCVQTGKIFGDMFNIYMSNRLGRLVCLRIGFAICAITTFGFVYAVQLPASAATVALLTLAFFQGAGIDLLWAGLNLYLAEIFPTTVRSTAFGFSMGLGRWGGIVSTSIGNLVPSMSFAFSLYAASFAIGAVAAFLPVPETAGARLADTATK